MHTASPKCTSFVEESDYVLIGGGGLLYPSEKHHENLLKLHESLAQHKKPYGFISLGIQCAEWRLQNPKFPFPKLKPFVKDAQFVFARSKFDLTILKKINPNTTYYPDLCFALFKSGLLKRKPESSPRFNLITISSQEHIQHYKIIIRQLVKLGLRHIHLVFSKADDFPDEEWDRLKIKTPEIFRPPDLISCAEYFEDASYVYTSRFHGFLFAKLLRVGHIIPMLPTYKIVNYNTFDEQQAINQLRRIKMILKS